MPTPSDPHEAVEAPPWSAAQGPPPTVQTWPRLSRPALEVYVRGQWRHCPVIAVQRYRDGRLAVQVDIRLDSDTSYQARTYRWDPAVMTVVRRGDPPLEL